GTGQKSPLGAAEPVLSGVPGDVGPVAEFSGERADRGPRALLAAVVPVEEAQQDGGVQLFAVGGTHVAVAVPGEAAGFDELGHLVAGGSPAVAVAVRDQPALGEVGGA